MIRLICFQSEPLQNANCYAKQIADAFYTRGFEFDCVTTAYPENAGTFADLALANNNDLWVFFDPPAPYKAENIRLIFKDTLKSDCSFVLTELEGKGFSFLKVSDLIYKENYTIDHTGMQIKN